MSKRATRYLVIILWTLFLSGTATFLWVLNGIGNGNSTVLSFLNMFGDAELAQIPNLAELENPENKFATIVYSCDSVEIGHFTQAGGNRVYEEYNSLPAHLVNALIATEDIRFREHSGIDFQALFRVAIKTVIGGNSSSGGGSTITQQLAKQLYTENARVGAIDRAKQKLMEWVIAVKLERLYTKEEIINLYLNHFDFNYQAVGIRSAARIYFDKLPEQLDIQESAMLVGMLQNPALYNPVRRPEKTMQRRSVVLSQMEKAGFINQQEYDSLKVLPLLPKTDKNGNYRLCHTADHKDGLAPYLREYVRKIMRARKPERSHYASWQTQQYREDSLAWETDPLFGWCNKNQKPDGNYYNLTTDGLRIYTTIDSRMQQYAEEAVVEHLRDDLQPAFNKEKKGQKNAPYNRSMNAEEVKNSLRRAMRQSERYVTMQSGGYTKEQIEEAFDTPVNMKLFTWEGEIDTIMTPLDSLRWQKQFLRAGFMCMDTLGHVKAYVGGPNFKFFQYDMVNSGRRQVGSTIKPLLYTLAMEEGRTPCDEELNAKPTLYDAAGRPWSPRDGGKERIGEMVTLRWGLMKSNNWISARVMSRIPPEVFVRFLHSAGIRNELDPVLSLCLGVCDISVAEMVTAYSAFPGRGQRRTPIYVTSITDNKGVELAHFTAPSTEVYSYDAYLKMLPILRDVVDRGTGARMRSRYGITAPMGGKTGTTNDNSDAWFMAFTPSLVAGTWVGGEERTIRFDNMAYGQGAAAALPIFAKFIKKVYEDKHLPYNQREQFSYPDDYDPCSGSFSETVGGNGNSEDEYDFFN